MKKIVKRLSLSLIALAVGLFFGIGQNVFAEENNEQESENTKKAAASISITPVNETLRISANSTYEKAFRVTNGGASTMTFEVYAAPYSFVRSEVDDSNQLSFNNETNFTQITRWITFQDVNGNYVERTTFSMEPEEYVDVHYKVTTPESIPGGGQYAVLFAHTLSNNKTAGGIKTEASPGLIIYARSDGETINSSEIKDLKILKSLTEKGKNEETRHINGASKVKNTGNTDFTAFGKLEVRGVLGNIYYETKADSTRARVSIIPDAELTVSDSWDETPYFGLFNVKWTVTAANGESETIEQLVLYLPAPIIVVMILLLTIIAIWIIIMVRKRKERRSRFMV